MKPTTNKIEESKWRGWLTSEVKFIIGIIGFVIGVVAPYYDIKQDVALIKQNHYTHIEQLQKDIAQLNERDVRLQEQYIELLKAFNK
ncbi:MAG TPA: hypothetical protein VLH94_01060 [Spirochaetia bacterium]|nr:hypothetical protein [Spirochaetia bacterium]